MSEKLLDGFYCYKNWSIKDSQKFSKGVFSRISIFNTDFLEPHSKVYSTKWGLDSEAYYILPSEFME